MNVKDEVRKIVEQELSQAKDNFYRAFIAFRGRDLMTFYGDSERTMREILEGYENRVSQMEACLKWVESHD